MLRMRGTLEGAGEPIDVEVLFNAQTELGTIWDRAGKIIVPPGICFSAGDEFLLKLPGAEEANLGLPDADSMHIVIDKASENYISFSQTVPPR